MSESVVVVGGGCSGVTIANDLDAWADVVLVEPNDAFLPSIAARRAVVDPE